MKRILLMAVLTAFATISVKAQTVDEVIKKNISALGGNERLKALKTMKMDLSITVQGMELPATSAQIHDVGRRTDFTVQNMTGTEVITKKQGWKFMPFMGHQKPEPSSAEEVKESAFTIDLQGYVVDYAKKGYKIELVGNDTVAGKIAHCLRITSKEGVSVDYFVDAESGNTVKLINKRTINGSLLEITSLLTDYKTQNGYSFPYTINQDVPGAGPMVIKITKVEINPPVDASIFKMPQ